MPNAQNLSIVVPPNPLAGNVFPVVPISRQRVRQPPKSVLAMIQHHNSKHPRSH